MSGKRQVSDGQTGKPVSRHTASRPRTVRTDETGLEDIRQLAEKDASKIVAQAYEEASRIINNAKQNAEHIAAKISSQNIESYAQLKKLLKSGHITENSYRQIDDLFVQIRNTTEQIIKADPVIGAELKDLIMQLEYWMESLAIESMKLTSLERWLEGTMELAKELRDKLDQG